MPRNVYDKASRFAAKLDPPGFLAWLLSLPPEAFVFRGWLDTRGVSFPTDTDRTGDTVARLDDPAAHGTPWAVAVEFQAEPDPLMFGRFLAYLSALWLGVKPDEERGSRFHVGAAVVNLASTGLASRRMEWPGTGLTTHLGVIERNLEIEPADELLGGIESGARSRCLLPWVPLMAGADVPSLAERWKQLAEAEPDRRRRAEYGGLALVFADKAGRKAIWAKALEGWNVTESSVVNEWIAQGEAKGEAKGRAEGRAEGRVTALLEILADKFGAVPSDLEAAIRGTTAEDRLRAWAAAAAKAPTLDEFRKLAGL